jgi:hypothetical protein
MTQKLLQSILDNNNFSYKLKTFKHVIYEISEEKVKKALKEIKPIGKGQFITEDIYQFIVYFFEGNYIICFDEKCFKIH